MSRLVTAGAALGPLAALGGCLWLGLYAVHNLEVRKGADWTGLGFGEFFLWGVAVVVGLGVVLALGLLLLVPRTRTSPPLLATALSGTVALAGLVFSAAAWSIVTDSSLVPQRSIEWGTPLITSGALVGLAPLLVAGTWLVVSRRGRG